MDPRRLWKRYAKHNPRFVGLFLLQLLGLRKPGGNNGRRLDYSNFDQAEPLRKIPKDVSIGRAEEMTQ
jgi:hypothetical protein